MNYKLIEDEISLNAVIEKCRTAKLLAVDTEFIRQRTYFPILGLFQIYDGRETFLIDPVAITDLNLLWDLFDEKEIVMHACSEDLDVFATVANRLPANFHDSQIAAAFAGHGSSLGFSGLVAEFEDITLDKGASRSNWLARPLSSLQLNYAAADVYYLMPCWDKLKTQLDSLGYYDFYLQEIKNIRRRKLTPKNPETIYKQYKNASLLSPRQLATLQALAKWRELYAIKHDLAVNFVVKEAHLLEVAKNNPRNLRDLQNLGLLPFEIKRHGKLLLNIVQQSADISDADLPASLSRISDYPNYKKTVQKIRGLVAQVAEEMKIPSEIIGSKKLINELLSWCWKLSAEERECAPKPLLLSNWREEIVGQKILNDLLSK